MAVAKLFKNGKSQAVRLPKDYWFEGESVFIKHFGNGVLLLPQKAGWSLLEESLEEFTSDFMNSRDQGAFENREGFSARCGGPLAQA